MCILRIIISVGVQAVVSINSPVENFSRSGYQQRPCDLLATMSGFSKVTRRSRKSIFLLFMTPFVLILCPLSEKIGINSEDFGEI